MLLFIVHVRHNTYNAYMHAGSNFMQHVRSVHSRTLCGSLTTSPTKLYTGTISVHITRQCLHTDHVRTNYYTDYAIHCVLATRSTNRFSTWTDPRREGMISDTLASTHTLYALHMGSSGQKISDTRWVHWWAGRQGIHSVPEKCRIPFFFISFTSVLLYAL